MRKDHRNLILSVALAGTVLANLATPVAAAPIYSVDTQAFFKNSSAVLSSAVLSSAVLGSAVVSVDTDSSLLVNAMVKYDF